MEPDPVGSRYLVRVELQYFVDADSSKEALDIVESELHEELRTHARPPDKWSIVGAYDRTGI
jgi:hypothetical protein